MVLNRDHKYYDDYLDIAERMMQLDLESAEEAARKAPESLKESMNVILTLDAAERDAGHDADFGKRQILSGRSRNESAGEIRHRKREYNQDWAMVDAFHYGFIQGKRYERARKAKRSESEAREPVEVTENV